MVRAFQSGLDSSPIMETELGGRSECQPNLQQTLYSVLTVHDPVSIEIPYAALVMARQTLDDPQRSFVAGLRGDDWPPLPEHPLMDRFIELMLLTADGAEDLYYWRHLMHACDESCTYIRPPVGRVCACHQLAMDCARIEDLSAAFSRGDLGAGDINQRLELMRSF
jgi:hypothetical protein